MGCKQSKEGYIPASDETTSKRKRATLQLDLTYDTKAADDERLAALLASTTASTPLPHKTGLTPVMTPTTAGAGASGQSSPPPRPLSDDGRPSSRRWSALAGDGSARAPSFKSPVKCRGSTAELSTESEGGEDDYGSDTESDSDSERESEGESETSRLLVPTSASKARKPGRETGVCSIDERVCGSYPTLHCFVLRSTAVVLSVCCRALEHIKHKTSVFACIDACSLRLLYVLPAPARISSLAFKRQSFADERGVRIMPKKRNYEKLLK